MSQIENRPAYAAGPNDMWRSLGEWEHTPEFEALVKKEFPAANPDLLGPVDRRRFLQLIGASAALASATSCRYEKEELRPFATRPEGYVPGDRRVYTSAFERDGVALPLHVTTVDGRPIKVDGNPDHPSSGGGSDIQAQAAILEFYDPDRSRGVTQWAEGQSTQSTWEKALEALKGALASRRGDGAGVAVLSEVSASPALASLRNRFQAQFPKARWVQFASGLAAGPLEGARLASGQGSEARMRLVHHLERARMVLTLDCDFLAQADGVRHRADFAKGRRPEGDMSRLYAVESRYTGTGASADHRLPLAPSRIGALLELLEQELAKFGMGGVTPASSSSFDAETQAFVHVLADDLWKHRGQALVMAGDQLAPAVHARVLALNERLGALGKTLDVIQAPAELDAPGMSGLEDLTGAMSSGGVEVLLILGGNPVYDAPGDLGFDEALARVAVKAHLSLYANETSRLCNWHLPKAHFLESWGDARSFDGTYSVVQPMIEPLHDGKSSLELLSELVEEKALTGLELVRRAFDEVAKAQGGGDALWRKVLHDGLLAGSASPTLSIGFGAGASAKLPSAATGIELQLFPCPKLGDGRYANNGWLQELPDYLTKVTWDNVLLVSVQDSREWKVTTGDVVKVSAHGKSIEAPVYVAPGHAQGAVSLAMGYGRTAAGRIGGDRRQGVDPVGVHVAPLRTLAQPFLIDGVQVEKTGKTYPLATTQEHHMVDPKGMAAREERMGALIRTGTKEEYDATPNFQEDRTHPHPPLQSLWDSHEYHDYKWGMSIDLSTCDGCNACVIACQAENNIPIVGKDQVSRGREMHWIRVDAYYRGTPEAPVVAHQPVACAHCENAPCEEVCPVAATVHSDEGLNDMVYNRCVGTRYCGNNCPYKVRRFNYYHYPKRFFGHEPELMGLGNNPSVTVRSRGVMEKCTYCVQRIQEAKIDAHNDGRRVQGDEVQTACQLACPPKAIVFGDLNDPASMVAQAQAGPRSYALLEELNIKPRTQYLARVNNPNPALAPAATEESHDGHGH